MLEKVLFPIEVTEFGIVIAVNWLLEKALSPIEVTEFGNTTFVIDLFTNEFSLIVTIPLGTVNSILTPLNSVPTISKPSRNDKSGLKDAVGGVAASIYV